MMKRLRLDPVAAAINRLMLLRQWPNTSLAWHTWV